MTVDTLTEFEFFRVFIVMATVGLIVFLVSFAWLTRGRVFLDRLGRAFVAADLCGLVRIIPLDVATFHRLSGLANLVFGWLWVASIGLSGTAWVYLAFALWREDYGKKKKESK